MCVFISFHLVKIVMAMTFCTTLHFHDFKNVCCIIFVGLCSWEYGEKLTVLVALIIVLKHSGVLLLLQHYICVIWLHHYNGVLTVVLCFIECLMLCYTMQRYTQLQVLHCVVKMCFNPVCFVNFRALFAVQNVLIIIIKRRFVRRRNMPVDITRASCIASCAYDAFY